MNSKSEPIFENPFGNIFQIALAQGADTIVSPTLPVDPALQGPLWGTAPITPTVTGSVPSEGKVKVKLEMDLNQDIKQDSIIKVKPSFYSGEIPVLKFQIKITYNPNKLKVINNSYIDTYFTKNSSITLDELGGQITIQGEALEDPKTINRTISNIDFQIKSTGIIDINVIQSESYVYSGNNENIIGEISNIELQIGGTGQIATVSQTISATSSLTPTLSTTPRYKEIPKSDLKDFSIYLPYFAGTLLVFAGVWLAKHIRSNKDEF